MAATMVLRKRFSVDEYYGMAGAGIFGEHERVELIDGDVVTMSPIGSRHTACVSSATQALVLAAHSIAIVQPQSPVRLDRFNEPQPDIVLLKPRADFYAARHAGPDDVLLVIEIAESSLLYDRGRKSALYASWGLAEYWMADLQTDTLWAFSSPDGERYRVVERHRQGESLAPRLLPSCVIPVSALLIG